MRAVVSGLVLGLSLLAAGTAGLSQAQSQRPAAQDRAGAASDLLALSFDAGDGRQQVTIIDPRQRVMAVYHVERASGALSLRSVRNFQWDLLMEEFNSEKPAPRDVHALLKR